MKSIRLLIVLAIFGTVFYSCEDPKEEDVTPPTVTITSPQNNSTVFEVINITCISTDNDKVSKVELWIDGEFTGNYDETEPYALEWNTTSYVNKTYTITIRSYDSSGNVTDSSPYILTVNNALSNPNSSEINSILYGIGGFSITWNKSTNGDFQSYQLEKSLFSDMSTRSEVFSSLDINDTVYVDADIDPLIFQYYWVTVTDTFNYSTTGVVDSSSLDPIPNSVDVESVVYDTTSMIVTWSKSQENDFSKYELSQSSGDSTNYSVIASIFDVNTTQFGIAEFDPLQINYFKVTVFDTLGQYSAGNYYTNDIDSPPNSVDVLSVAYNLDEMTISWEEYVPNLSRILLRTSDGMSNDFISYEILYSDTETGDKSVLATINNEQTTTYSLTNFNPTHENWYWVRVNDFWGQSSIGAGRTNSIDDPPESVDILLVDYSLTEMVISWEQSEEDDFTSYELFQLSGEEDEVSIAIIEDISTNSYALDVFDPTVENWFVIKVTDWWGLQTVGNPLTNMIDLPPTQVTLNPINFENGSFTITWSQNNDEDFSGYYLYESLNEDMSNQELIFSSNIRSDTTFAQPVSEARIRYYQVLVMDIFNLETMSSGEIGSSYLIFNSVFGGAESDYGESIQQTTDGGFIITGTTHSFGSGNSDVWLVKSNSHGEEEWNQSYGGIGAEKGKCVQLTTDGGYIIVGSVHSEGYWNMWLVKTNSLGTEEWSQTFGGALNDFGEFVQQTSDGGFVIVGSLWENSGSDIWLIKTNSEGIEEWSQTFGGTFQEKGFSVQQTDDGGFIIAGEDRSIGSGNGDVWLIKTNSSGVEEWNQTFGGTDDDSGISVQQTTDAGFIVAGFTESFGSGVANAWLIKTNSTGNEEWNQTFGETGGYWASSVEQTIDGGYVMAGTKLSGETSDTWLIKTNSSGVQEWSQDFGGMNYDFGRSVRQTSLGGFVLLGSTESFGNGSSDVWLIKTDPLGKTTPFE